MKYNYNLNIINFKTLTDRCWCFSRISSQGTCELYPFPPCVPLGMKYYSPRENLIYQDTRVPYYITFMTTATQKLDNYITSQFSFMTTNSTKRRVITPTTFCTWKESLVDLISNASFINRNLVIQNFAFCFFINQGNK